jgi:fimbrial chaperone protein
MTRWKMRAAAWLLFACGLPLLAAPAYALLVRPVVIELTSTGNGTSSALEVVNDRNIPMTVEVKVQDLALPVKGDPILTPSNGDDFLVFPTIAKIPAGGHQVFRVRYIGDPNPAHSRLFMFSTSELPISAEPTSAKAQVQVLYSINSVVAVRPPKSNAAIKVVDVQRGSNAKGEQGLEITFENDGAAHGFVGASTMSLTDGPWKKALAASDMGKAFGLGLVPADSKRVMFLVLPDVPAAGVIQASIKPAA